MKHFSSFAVYPTKNIYVGRFTFAGFFYKHWQYLVAANNVAYAPIILETKNLYTSTFGEITQYNEDFGAQQAYTKQVGVVLKSFNAEIDIFYEAVVFKFHKNSVKYKECFPDGVLGYKHNHLDEYPAKIQQALDLADKYSADLGTDIKDAFTQIKTDFNNAATLQSTTHGHVKSIIPNYKAKKELIDKQILKNICTILIQNLDNPMVLTSFFDEYLIYPKKKKTTTPPDDDDGEYVLPVGMGKTVVADVSFSVDDTLIITNTGDASLQYYFAATADEEPPAEPFALAIDEEAEVKANTIGAPEKKFLIFINPSTTDNGEVEIMLA